MIGDGKTFLCWEGCKEDMEFLDSIPMNLPANPKYRYVNKFKTMSEALSKLQIWLEGSNYREAQITWDVFHNHGWKVNLRDAYTRVSVDESDLKNEKGLEPVILEALLLVGT